ncbi:MAG TPA: M23 family metallopeptidase [Bacteroidales bacterium]|nr:M23 family metallopeptidase [Bacteroidales bacterium]
MHRELDAKNLQIEIIQKRLNQIEDVLADIEQRDDNIYRTIFEADPIPRSVRQAGFGGVNRYEEIEKINNSDLILNTAQRLDKISKQLYVQSKSFDEVIERALDREQMLASLPAIQPVANKDLSRTASGYGWRVHPIYKIRKFHEGMDFTAPTGTEIYATADGVIAEIETNEHRGYGNMALVDHGYGYETVYAHMERIKVKIGQHVKRGDVIGYVGNTGLSTGPHLHYEVRKNGKAVNPINFYFNDLSPNEFDQIIEISSNSGQTFD